MTSQTPCRYFAQGYCKNGASCRFSHDLNSRGPFGNAGSSNNTTSTATYTPDTMKRDMVDERPLWPLSSYGAAKNAPNLLPDLDLSSEELRVRAYDAQKSGQMQQYATFESDAIAKAQAQYTKVINDPKAAHQAQFLLIEKGNAKPPAFGSSTAAFGQAPTGFGSSTSTFGKSATFGQPSTTPAFGQPLSTPAFGQPAATPAFGQQSASNTTTPAFGSAFGRPSAFGQPTAPKPAFGAPAFGQPAFSQSSFGQSSSLAASAGSGGGSGFSAFASKPATFGQPAFGQSGFGSSPSAPVFGQSSFGSSTVGGGTGAGTGGGGFSAFASSEPTGFTQAAGNPLPSTGAFGSSTSAFAQSASNPFGASTQSTATDAFGQPIQPASRTFGSNTSAFGTPKPFTGFAAAAGSGPSAFGSSTTTGANPFASAGPSSNPFSASIAATAAAIGQPNPTAPVSGPSGLPAKPSEATTLSAFSQPPNTNSAFGRPTSVFGQPAKQNAFGGSLLVGPGGKIKVNDPYAEFLPKDYLQMLPLDVRAAFEADKFEPGKVPLWVPPMELR